MKRGREIKVFRVESLEQLKVLCSGRIGDMVQFFIMLGGFARSSKRISYSPEEDFWVIVHEIDESSQELTTEQLIATTNFMEAIEKNALFFNDFQN